MNHGETGYPILAYPCIIYPSIVILPLFLIHELHKLACADFNYPFNPFPSELARA